MVERVLGDTKSTITTIIILNIILKQNKIWGYQLKQDLLEITGVEIQNSTLYTILRNLEIKYSMLKSEMVERRRYYSLTQSGIVSTKLLTKQWYDIIKKNEKYLKIANEDIKSNLG